MKTTAISLLILTILSESAFSAQATGFSEVVKAKTTPQQLAQLFYPLPQEKPMIQVIGRGRVSRQADSVQLKFNFQENANVSDTPLTSMKAQFKQVQASLTKENLKSIKDALIAMGIPAEAIEIKGAESNGNPFSFPFPFPTTESAGDAQVSVILESVTKERLNKVVNKVTEVASKSQNFSLVNVTVNFRLQDCENLEREAYIAAVKDARSRATAIASALDAELVALPSISEPFYNVFLPKCNAEGNLLFSQNSVPYNPDAPLEFEVTQEVFVTYTLK